MLKRKYSMIAGAVLAATPLVSKAATVTFSWDGGDFSDSNGSLVVTGTAANPILTVTAGDQINLGLDATVAANPNAAAALTYNTSGSKSGDQPANLGLANFGFGATDNNPTSASMDLTNGVTFDPPINQETPGVVVNGGVGNVADAIAGGFLAATVATNSSDKASLGYGANPGPSEIFDGLNIDANAVGTAIFTPNLGGAGNQAVVSYVSGGTSTASKPVYGNTTLADANATAAGILTVIVIPTSTGGGHAIVSLVNGATSDTTGNYGSILSSSNATFSPSQPVANDINVVGSTTAGYNVGSAHLTTASGVTSNVDTTFTVTPTGGTEVYALKLLVQGVTPTSAQLSQIVSDINGSELTDGLVASTPISGAFSGEFPGYSILLTADATAGTSNLGFDFTQETSVAGVTVTDVAAVPEPATVGGLILGAAGLLLGRRKSRAV
jgi:hypothetical protein